MPRVMWYVTRHLFDFVLMSEARCMGHRGGASDCDTFFCNLFNTYILANKNIN